MPERKPRVAKIVHDLVGPKALLFDWAVANVKEQLMVPDEFAELMKHRILVMSKEFLYSIPVPSGLDASKMNINSFFSFILSQLNERCSSHRANKA